MLEFTSHVPAGITRVVFVSNLKMDASKMLFTGDGPGVVIRTHASYTEGPGSNLIPEIVTYDTKVIVTNS